MGLYLTPEAHAGLKRFCEAQGVDMTAFLEALGLEVADRDKPGSLRRIVDRAKEIHRVSHARGRNRPEPTDDD